jgi:hypothetical protein
MNDPGAVYLLEYLKSFKGIKSNAEKAMAQIDEQEWHWSPDPESNSVAILVRHISGNLRSRFTDFLTADGEKPDRNRDAEFLDPDQTRENLLAAWESSWDILFATLEQLQPSDLLSIVHNRREPYTVVRALQRQLVHYAYHGGQIVYLCKQIRTVRFRSLSIPRGASGDYLNIPPSHTAT